MFIQSAMRFVMPARQYSTRWCVRIIWLVCLCCGLLLGNGRAADAAITLRGAEQSAIATAAPSGISYVGAGSFARRDGCGSINPSIPTGSAGDMLIALVLVREEQANITVAGWNQYFLNSVNNFKVAVFWRIATGGDPNIVTSGGTGSCRSLIARISRFSGVDAASPFETSPIQNQNWVQQNSTNIDSGIETTTVANAMAIVAGFVADNRTVSNADASGDGYTESFDSTNTTGRDSAISLHYKLQGSPGDYNIDDWLLSGTVVDQNYGVMFALSPDSGAGSGLTINVPAGTTTDDVMVAAIAVRPSTVTLLPPAGWTSLIRTSQGAGNSNAQEIFYRIATATEPASYSWGFAVPITGAAGGVLTYSGVDTASPFDMFAGNTTPSSTSHTANSVTTTVADVMLVSAHSFSSSMTWLPPGGMTERVDISSLIAPNAIGIALEMSDELQAIAGATGNRTATTGGNNDTGVAHLLGLRPGGPDGPVQYLAMDESSWTGVGTVMDGSGNNNHGDPVGNAKTVANGRVCRAGETVNDGDAINTRLDVNSAIGGRGTATFWFRPNWSQSGGERNQARVIFDATLGDKYFKLIKADNRNNVYTDNNARRRLA